MAHEQKTTQTLLLVEPDKALRVALGDFLRKHTFFEILTASTFIGVTAIAGKKKITFLISDCSPDGIDGIAVLQRLLESEHPLHKVVFTTNAPESRCAKDALSYVEVSRGLVAGVVEKPLKTFDPVLKLINS